MLHTFTAAFAALEVRGPTVPDNCEATRAGSRRATERKRDLILKMMGEFLVDIAVDDYQERKLRQAAKTF
jgi:hypothetical protein